MIKLKVNKEILLKRKNILLAGFVVLVIIIITSVVCAYVRNPVNIWYVDKELEDQWAMILKEEPPPDRFKEIRVWDGVTIPTQSGILITTRPWKTDSKVSVYRRLSWDLEYQGAIVLAVDPWMVFYKYRNPGLTASRVLSETGGSGILLLPGKDMAAVRAWTGRFIQDKPGSFPDGNAVWREWEEKLFSGRRFPNGSLTFSWGEALFRLMGNETTWLYAPLSVIRHYRDPRKSILEVAAFPELGSSGEYSMQAKILWALPTGSSKKIKKLDKTIAWLKNANTQTIIADTLEWIPADPYGKPYDPVSFNTHRIWLTAEWVYSIDE